MYLTISKRFEISLSYRYHQPGWSRQENVSFFGSDVGSDHGYGGSFTAFFVFNGEVDRDNGMVINVTIIKERINKLLAKRYDHKYLNVDTAPFDRIVPTPENVARQLLLDAAPLFDDESADLVAVHLKTSGKTSATAYSSGLVERHATLEFSAARRTYSPNLTEEENTRLFGVAASPSGHGHHYHLRATLSGGVDDESGMIIDPSDARRALKSLYMLLDHRNLTHDVPELDEYPLTTESLASFSLQWLRNRMPVTRLRLWENPYFYAECHETGWVVMGTRTTFRAAHRLHSPSLTDEANLAIYGKCNNPSGHGHEYIVEAAVDGHLDETSGTLFPLEDLLAGTTRAVEPWHLKHLDKDTDDFTDRPSTAENIVHVLWPRLEDAIGRSPYRLRLWETPNNRFTLRRDEPGTNE